MPIVQPIFLYLNDSLVDEVWISLKQDGLPVERIRAASMKASAKAKFGLGKLWQWLATDLNVEGGAQGEVSQGNKVLFPSFFRAIVLPELLPDKVTWSSSSVAELDGLSIGTFIEVDCGQSHLMQIPTLADYYRIQLVGALTTKEDHDAGLEDIEAFTASKKAFAFSHLLENDEGSESVLGMVFELLEDEFLNAMSMSNDDQVVLISTSREAAGQTLVVSFLDEKYLRRHLGGYTGKRAVRVLGKLAFRRGTPDEAVTIIGVEAISISLA